MFVFLPANGATPVGPGGFTCLDPGAIIALPPVPADGAGNVALPLYVSRDPNIAGLPVLLQGVVFPPAGGYALTNAIRFTFGFANHDP